MENFDLYAFNEIRMKKAFDISALITAYSVPQKINEDPYWEYYGFSQIFLVLEGEGQYETEDGSYPIEAGMMFYRPANKRSCYSWNSEKVRFALISFVCTSPSMACLGPQPIRLYEEEISILLDLIQTAVRICEPVKENEERIGMRVRNNVPDVVLSFISASLERFLAMVYCRLLNINLLVDETQKVNYYFEEARLIADVKTYLKEHLAEPLTLSEISTYFGVSKTTLMRKFRKETNSSVMEYFTNLKIEEAKRRIHKTSKSFTIIADELGFSSVNYFSKVFKARTGVTPTAYSKHASKRRISAEI